MSHRPNIERRIKRHVLGKVHTYFAATAPGMESLCRDELVAPGLGAREVSVTKGGVLFQGRIRECYMANLKLRTANRVLMRIDTFRATNFGQLAKKMADIPWELFLHRDAAVKIRASASRSRLYHTGAVAEQCRHSMARKRDIVGSGAEEQEEISRFPQQVFIRAVKDHFVVSIDSSGDLLYKRSLKTQGGKAPLRETTAAAVLALSAYHGDEPLMDPMCGSGTFSLEAAMIANQIPPGWYRTFAFMGWPAFRFAQWKHLRREAETCITTRTDPIILAADKMEKTCDALSRIVLDRDLSGTISVIKKDFFDITPSDVPGEAMQGKRGLLVLNPPYGRRLETKRESEKLFSQICLKLKSDFKGWKIALLVPKGHPVRQVPFPVTTQGLFHGGLRLSLLTARIP